MSGEPIIYRITHLWPNKQPGQGSRTAQIKPEAYVWPNALPSRFVSLQDYERLARSK